jgi:hypothetical protein
VAPREGRHRTVGQRNALRPFAVFVANEAGDRISLVAQYAFLAAADLEHQKIVRQPTTGPMPKETLSR